MRVGWQSATTLEALDRAYARLAEIKDRYPDFLIANGYPTDASRREFLR